MTTNEVATKRITESKDLTQEYMDGKYYEEMSFLEFALIKYAETKNNTEKFEYESIPNQSVKSR